jgi:hypothetical protein
VYGVVQMKDWRMKLDVDCKRRRREMIASFRDVDIRKMMLIVSLSKDAKSLCRFQSAIQDDQSTVQGDQPRTNKRQPHDDVASIPAISRPI